LLAAAMRALDEGLRGAEARDGRALGWELAAAIRAAGAARVAGVVGARRVRTRWILGWDADELAWWRALDETLAAEGGYAHVTLPAFDKRLEGSRVRDPLEVLADVVARHLDAAPMTETIPAVLGDLASLAPASRGGPVIRLVHASDTADEARAAAAMVREALEGGARVERVVIAYPTHDERTLLPLRRALEDAGVVYFDAMGAPGSTVPVVAAALQALSVAESPTREAVARVLRSGYVDAPRLLGDPSLPFREAERKLARFARALETHATAAGTDDADRLVRTATPSEREGRSREVTTVSATVEAPRPVAETAETTSDATYMRRLVDVLLGGQAARTRSERVRAARRLFAEIGLAARAGRGALATFARDEAPSGVERAERLAVARDVRAWEVLEAALDAYETAALRAPSTSIIDAEVFRLELIEVIDASSRLAPLPSGGRTGAVRLARLADVAGEELDLLVVLDANEGVLPRESSPITLLSDALEEGLARVANQSNARDPSEIAARDLAALATSAAEAKSLSLITTSDSADGNPSAPSRIFLALESAIAPVVHSVNDPQTPTVHSANDPQTPTVHSMNDPQTPTVHSVNDPQTPTVHSVNDRWERVSAGAPALTKRQDAEGESAGQARSDHRAEGETAGQARSDHRVDGEAAGQTQGGSTERDAAVRRRIERERARELFFLDPARPRSETVGALAEASEIRRWVSSMTGDSAARSLAVTSIERFAQCPFKGYAHVVLAAREGDEQHELPDAREEGNLGHAALAAAFVETVDEWSRRPRAAASILERGLAAAERVLAASAVHAPLRAIVRLRIRESVRAVLLRAIDDVDWNFILAEQPFQRFEVTNGTTHLWLRGTIDRVDRARTTAPAYRVIDYKRSKSTVRDSTSLLGETALQVPLYAAVIALRFEAHATGAYLPIQARDLALEPAKSTARAEARVTELAARPRPSEIERRVLDVVDRARSGWFAPLPARESECTRCSVSGGCRKPRFAMAPADEDEPET
jgi:RecB family exonuclease